ncbi:MAG: hypothetical protein ACO1NM_13570 [Sphingobium phenoxybenzoativorans]|uniref:Uncharacterized protein n=1 Tax=Sphingobium phenoxybenzoativorans TaxID=1592790 RepID=A0A975K4Z4_9SPHN|nr:hypothetical protein [Sphingobium phenoxybenzoativorans]QUT04925.1 hypothetical protein KFK14_18155 [Sphingobium phenoxybenzoativorans]
MTDIAAALETYALERIAEGHTVTLFFGSHSLLAKTLAVSPDMPGMLSGEGMDETQFLVSAAGLVAVRANKIEAVESTVGFRKG